MTTFRVPHSRAISFELKLYDENAVVKAEVRAICKANETVTSEFLEGLVRKVLVGLEAK